MARSLGALVALCALVAVLAVSSVSAQDDSLYSDKYDYIDVDAVLANDRLRNQYYECFVNDGVCATPDAKYIKEKFPEVIVTKCKRCTQKQKDAFEKIALYYHDNEPDKWEFVLRKAVEEHSKKS